MFLSKIVSPTHFTFYSRSFYRRRKIYALFNTTYGGGATRFEYSFYRIVPSVLCIVFPTYLTFISDAIFSANEFLRLITVDFVFRSCIDSVLLFVFLRRRRDCTRTKLLIIIRRSCSGTNFSETKKNRHNILITFVVCKITRIQFTHTYIYMSRIIFLRATAAATVTNIKHALYDYVIFSPFFFFCSFVPRTR